MTMYANLFILDANNKCRNKQARAEFSKKLPASQSNSNNGMGSRFGQFEINVLKSTFEVAQMLQTIVSTQVKTHHTQSFHGRKID